MCRNIHNYCNINSYMKLCLSQYTVINGADVCMPDVPVKFHCFILSCLTKADYAVTQQLVF